MQDIIKSKAYSLGFSAIGFTSPELPARAALGLQEFLDNGHHGDMQWMADKADRRADPKTLWPEVKSIIVLGHNYGPGFDPMEKLAYRDRGNISCYALNADYHDVIKKKLKELARWVAQTYGCDVKVFVDTAPVMEKPLAEAGGLGWQGKHTSLVSREFGSWLFLGSIFLSCDVNEVHGHRISSANPARPVIPSPIGGRSGGGQFSTTEHTSPHPNPSPTGEGTHCGTCTRCLDVCPTKAFTSSGKLDARKCISYLTIEHKGQIPLEFRKPIGNRIYGCDDCLAVCPWNKFAQVSQESAYHPRTQLQSPLLRDLAQLDDAAFRQMFAKSSIKRIGRDRFVRNVLVAIGNSGDMSLQEIITPLLEDTSPLVAEMAAWALDELKNAPI